MKWFIINVLLFLIFNSAIAQDCGVERWPIKTLSDSDTTKINFSRIVETTVHKQVMLEMS